MKPSKSPHQLTLGRTLVVNTKKTNPKQNTSTVETDSDILSMYTTESEIKKRPRTPSPCSRDEDHPITPPVSQEEDDQIIQEKESLFSPVAQHPFQRQKEISTPEPRKSFSLRRSSQSSSIKNNIIVRSK